MFQTQSDWMKEKKTTPRLQCDTSLCNRTSPQEIGLLTNLIILPEVMIHSSKVVTVLVPLIFSSPFTGIWAKYDIFIWDYFVSFLYKKRKHFVFFYTYMYIQIQKIDHTQSPKHQWTDRRQ